MFRLANPARFMRFSGAILPWCTGATALLLVVGLILALFVVPPDQYQGDRVRIMYVHVPAAYMASLVYFVVAAASAMALIWRHPLADIAAQEAAPLGAGFTLICLVTGSIWGKSTWGTWWQWWDTRLDSVLILFFLYLGYIALIHAFDSPTRGAKAGAILAIVGIMMLPVIKFSVDCMPTLHQTASIFRIAAGSCPVKQPDSLLHVGQPTMPASMLWPLGVMALGFTLFFVTLLLVRMRSRLLDAKIRALRLAV